MNKLASLEKFFEEMAAHSNKIPLLPDEAFYPLARASKRFSRLTGEQQTRRTKLGEVTYNPVLRDVAEV